MSSQQRKPLQVAVIGGGIVGLALVTGLVRRNIQVKLYEKTASFKPIGAGIGFTPNTKEALALLHPGALEAEQKLATANGDPKKPNDWLRYIDGYHHTAKDEDEEALLFELYTGYRGFEGCVRAHFLEELLKLIPSGTIEFNKGLSQIVDHQGGDVELRFADGSTATASVVIGCDGIKSIVRGQILGEDHPAAEPSYNHQYAIRGVIPMELAIEALGDYKARNRHMHLGPNSHVVTVPIGLGSLLNVVAFILDPNDWPDDTAQRLTLPANGGDIIDAFKDFGRPVRNLIKTLVDLHSTEDPTNDASRAPAGVNGGLRRLRLDKWGIFDSVDNPAPTFSKGRIGIAGDAAHAMSPHHGAGAGIGIEDALVLSELLSEVAEGGSPENRDRTVHDRPESLRAALQAFTNIRKERGQFAASSSRVIGEVFEWRYPKTMRNWDLCLEELTWRSHKIWHHDQKAMLHDAKREYQRLLEEGQQY